MLREKVKSVICDSDPYFKVAGRATGLQTGLPALRPGYSTQETDSLTSSPCHTP